MLMLRHVTCHSRTRSESTFCLGHYVSSTTQRIAAVLVAMINGNAEGILISGNTLLGFEAMQARFKRSEMLLIVSL